MVVSSPVLSFASVSAKQHRALISALCLRQQALPARHRRVDCESARSRQTGRQTGRQADRQTGGQDRLARQAGWLAGWLHFPVAATMSGRRILQ